jgi:hypothetical protein
MENSGLEIAEKDLSHNSEALANRWLSGSGAASRLPGIVSRFTDSLEEKRRAARVGWAKRNEAGCSPGEVSVVWVKRNARKVES